MSQPITIVDRGRGPQLSSSRITVQDLVPYFQDDCPDDEIIRWIPVLTREEIAIVRRYYEENKAALDEQDRLIRERTAERTRQQQSSPGIAAILRRGAERMAALREEFEQRKQAAEPATVITLLADANIQGQVGLLVARMQGDTWRDFWDYFRFRYVTFADVGLQPSDCDAVVWRRCQEQDIILLTDNRNDDGPESLEATLRAHITLTSLPVFTIGNVRLLSPDSDYANRVIDRLIIYLLDLDNLRGTGRLYLP